MRREWKIGETEVGYVEHSGTRGVTPYWYPYATRDMGKIRIEASFWTDAYAPTEAAAEEMAIQMAHALNAVKMPNDPSSATASTARSERKGNDE